MKKLLIIGGSGFFGKSIVDCAINKKLIKHKINEICIISRSKISQKKTYKHIKVTYITKNITPNLVIILKSNFDIIKKRLKERSQSNKFDKLKKIFYKKVQRAYISLSKKNKRKYLVYDSSKNDNHLEKKIFKEVLFRINK